MALGYALSGQALGVQFEHFRATSASNPDSCQPTATLTATFDVDSTFQRPPSNAKPVGRAYLDITQTQTDGYLVEAAPTVTAMPPQTFFVQQQSLGLPPTAVLCDAVVSLARPAAQQGVGLQPGYMTVSQATNVPLATGWPASMLLGIKGEKNTETLPDSTRDAWNVVLLPATPGVTIQVDDVLTVDLGQVCKVSPCKLSALG